MATAVKVVFERPVNTRVIPVIVTIYEDPKTGIPTADKDPFWIYKSQSEEVVWLCGQKHAHGDGKCFTVTFENETPFAGLIFKDHGARSGLSNVKGDPNKLYKYTVSVPGHPPSDPQGGVKE